MVIKDKDNHIILSVELTKDAVHEEELMKSNFIRLSWNDRTLYTLPVGAYIEVDGVKYMLLDPYTPKKNRHRSFTYQPEFQHPIMWLGRLPFYTTVPNPDDPEDEIVKYDWSYANYPSTIIQYVATLLNKMKIPYLYDENNEWGIAVDSSLPVTGVCSFNSLDILSACGVIANTFKCQYNFDYENKVIRFGNLNDGFALHPASSVTLKSGVNIGIASVSDSKEDYHNAYYVQGSTRNLSKVSESGDNVQVTERLQLNPDTNPNSIIYINDQGQEVTEQEFEDSHLPFLAKSLVFDDIYPKYNLYLYNIRERRCWLLNENSQKISATSSDGWQDTDSNFYKYYSKWYFRLAYYTETPISGKTAILTEEATETTPARYWYNYDFEDDVFGKITSNGAVTLGNLSCWITDVPSNNIFTGDEKVMPPNSIPGHTIPYYEVEIKYGNTEKKMAVFAYNGYLVLNASLVGTTGVTLPKNTTFSFISGVDSTKADDSHKNSPLIADKVLSIAFQPNYEDDAFTSPLTSHDFELVHFNAQTTEKEDDDIDSNGFTAQKGDFRIVFTEEGGLRMPTTFKGGLYPKPKTISTDGDISNANPSIHNNIGTLFNIVVDNSWKLQAQDELKQAALKEIAYYSQDLNKYTAPSNPLKFRLHATHLHIGQRVVYDNGQDLNPHESEHYTLNTQVQKLVTRLDKPEIVTITMGNEKTKGTIATMKDQIETIIAGGLGSSEGGGISESQFLKLLTQYGDKRYIRRDVNDETNTDLTANKFIAKEGVKTDTIGGKSGDVLEVEDDLQVNGDTSIGGDATIEGETVVEDTLHVEKVAVYGENANGGDIVAQSSIYQAQVSGWAIDKNGNMEVSSLKVRNYLETEELRINRLQAQEGDTIYTDNDQIEEVEEIVDETEGTVLYRLTFKEKWEGYFTAQRYGNILKGIINTLAAAYIGALDNSSGSPVTFTAVVSPTGNPKEQGYYEYADGKYVPTGDLSVETGKTYYTVSAKGGYEEEDYSATLNPREVGLYERSGSTYFRSTDTEMDVTKTYYRKIQGEDSAGNKYFTSWMWVVGDRNTAPAMCGLNQVLVALWEDYDSLPQNKNFAPCVNMALGRWGCIDYSTPIDPEHDTPAEIAEKERLIADIKARQTFFYLSASEGRFMKLKDVAQPLLEEGNYGMVFGNTPDFIKTRADWEQLIEKHPHLKDRDYLFAQGLIYSDLVQLNIKGVPVVAVVDCGDWIDGSTAGTAIATGDDSALADEDDNITEYDPGDTIITPKVTKGIYFYRSWNVATCRFETHTVRHKNGKWMCLVDQPVITNGVKVYHEPKWNSVYWKLVEGNSDFSVDLESNRGTTFRIGYVNTTIIPTVFYGMVPITEDLSAEYFSWTRTVDTSEERSQAAIDADTAWNTLHQHVKNLALGNGDMPMDWGYDRRAIFECTVTIINGSETRTVTQQVIV